MRVARVEGSSRLQPIMPGSTWKKVLGLSLAYLHCSKGSIRHLRRSLHGEEGGTNAGKETRDSHKDRHGSKILVLMDRGGVRRGREASSHATYAMTALFATASVFP